MGAPQEQTERRVLGGESVAAGEKLGQDRLEKAAEIFRGLGSRPYSDLAQNAMAGPG
jgi:hypothetical protein